MHLVTNSIAALREAVARPSERAAALSVAEYSVVADSLRSRLAEHHPELTGSDLESQINKVAPDLLASNEKTHRIYKIEIVPQNDAFCVVMHGKVISRHNDPSEAVKARNKAESIENQRTMLAAHERNKRNPSQSHQQSYSRPQSHDHSYER
jgi:hypothetical protein